MLGSRFIVRIIGLLLALLLLPGCSTLRIGYGQATELVYWWIDGYFDIDDSQTARLRDELARLHQWHRAQELPLYAAWLRKTRQLAAGDVTTEQVCALYADIRGLADRLTERVLAPAADLLPTLTQEQLEHLQKKFDKNNQEFAREFQRGTDLERRERRLKTAVERATTVYGQPNEEQVAVLRGQIQNSGFDPRFSLAERKRRQQDLVLTLRRLLAEKATTAQAKSALAAYVERSWDSPDPRNRAYAERARLEACANIAQLHNSTTPAQREQAARLFSGYEADLSSMMAVKR